MITQVGTATYTANNPVNLTGVVPTITATGITGDNSATWNPTINVVVPGGFAANGSFSTTINASTGQTLTLKATDLGGRTSGAVALGH